SHKQFRAILKKEKRRKKRQALAQLRDAELTEGEGKCDPSEDDNELEEEEKQLEVERALLHQKWLEREQRAQEEFQLKKAKEDAARRRKEDEERRIREEWEEQQRKEKEEEEQKQQEKKDREEAVQKMLDQAESQLENGSRWHNPEAPEDYGTEKDRANCPFYLKTGACRFGDRCSRKHARLSSSQTLLVRGMFVTFGMEQSKRDDYDTDASLEYSEEEIYQQFVDFYEDVLPEFKNVGKVIQFKISCNHEPHLRGNVYVQYQMEEECQEAFAFFNGRWYAGRQLQCEFSPVTRWKTAICGLYERQKCPRGKNCNFLHVFKNPNNEFWEADRDINVSPERTNQFSNRRERTGNYSEYYSRPRRWHSPSPGSSQRRNGESERRRRSDHRSRSRDRRRSLRSRSRERRRSQSRERSRDRGKSYSKSRSRSRGRRRSASRGRSRERSPSKGNRRRKLESKSKSRSRSRDREQRRSHSRGRSRERSPSRGERRKRCRSNSKERAKSLSSDQSRSRSRTPSQRHSKKSKKKKSKKEKKKRNRSKSKSKDSRKKKLNSGANSPDSTAGDLAEKCEALANKDTSPSKNGTVCDSGRVSEPEGTGEADLEITGNT
uniref:Zinc finger CCCH-type, RNA binding motif and serine/arginine rich 2 n=2 Tax=Latimeria chalumnae TaxID=7897 RepID=H3B096_LATCH